MVMGRSAHVRRRDLSAVFPRVENPVIKGKIFRIVMLVAGATGLLALFESVAHASTGTNLNHCEPLQRV
jgi:hypothetical protein